MTSTLNAPTIQTLPNGLTIIAEQMPVEAVNLNIWLNVGSFQETNAINGMAHFLEHMVFKGTPRLVAGEFERTIEERGAVTNAATSPRLYTLLHHYSSKRFCGARAAANRCHQLIPAFLMKNSIARN